MWCENRLFKGSIALLLILLFGFGFGQSKIPGKIKALNESGTHFENFDVFSKNDNPALAAKFAKAASDVTVLDINSDLLNKLIEKSPNYLSVNIPYGEEVLEVLLYQQSALTESFEAHDQDGKPISYNPGKYYRGAVKGDYTSLAVFSFFENDVIGVVSTDTHGNLNIGKSTDGKNYVSYSESNLFATNPFVCNTDYSIHDAGKTAIRNFDEQTTMAAGRKCVKRISKN